MPTGTDFIVRRTNLRDCRFVEAPVPDETELQPGQALLKVDCFAFTANNVTYGVVGEMMSYWNFFPAEEGWGRIPVWGFGDVVLSDHDGLAMGERVYGYFPMSTHLVVQPDRLTPAGFVDAAPHRAALPPVYNQYTLTRTDPSYEKCYEDQQILLRPLFGTSFLIDDFLDDNDFFGARAVVLSSASSKTSFGLAFLLKRRGSREVIGLTSPGNVGFVEGLGCYDRVLTYDAIDSLPSDQPVAFVDMAGNGSVLSALHHHYRDNMKHSCQVGLTHWDQGKREPDLPGAEPAFFFAPTQVEKRTKDWGPGGFQERTGRAWKDFLVPLKSWIRVVRGSLSDVERVYLDVLEARARPDEGHILSLDG